MADLKTPAKGIQHEDQQTQADSMQAYYELHAKIYDITRWSFLFGRKEIIKILPIDDVQAPHIVEIGCGTGYNLKRLAKRYPKARLTGIDVSKEMLQKSQEATKAYKDRVNFIGMPYGSETQPLETSVDAILCSYSLTMINPQWQDVILQAKQDLKQGGVFAAVDFHASRFPWFEKHMGNNHVRMDGHLLPFFKKHFNTTVAKVKSAYGGVWEYFVYTGRKM